MSTIDDVRNYSYAELTELAGTPVILNGGDKYAYRDKRGMLHLQYGNSSRDFMILPFLKAGSHEHRRLVEGIVSELNEAYKPEYDAWGESSVIGVKTSFDTLRTLMSHKMHHAGWSQIDNRGLRGELGLDGKEHEDVFRDILAENGERFYDVYVCDGLPHQPGSQTSYPRFSKDVEYKRSLVRALLKDKPRETWDVLCAGAFTTDHARSCEMLGITRRAYRVQPESSSKERMVADVPYTASGGRIGKLVKADKTVTVNGTVWDDWSAGRVRSMYGLSYAYNIPLMVIDRGFKKYTFAKYAFAFKHRGREDIRNKILGWAKYHGVPLHDIQIVCSDYSQFDTTQLRDHLEIMRAARGKALREGGAEALINYLYMANYDTPCIVGQTDGILWGDPLDLSKNKTLHSGSKSGTGDITSSNNGMSSADFMTMIKIGAAEHNCCVDKERREAFLLGLDPYVAGLFAGDDVLLFGRRHVVQKVVEQFSNSRFKIAIEDGKAFIGFVVNQTDDDIIVNQDAGVMFRSLLTNERSIDHSMRENFLLGMTAVLSLMHDHPLYGELIRLRDRHFTKVFGHSLTSWLAQQDGFRKDSFLSEYDALFLTNPQRIHYMFEEDELSEHLQRAIEDRKSPVDDLRPFVDYVIKNDVMSKDEFDDMFGQRPDWLSGEGFERNLQYIGY